MSAHGEYFDRRMDGRPRPPSALLPSLGPEEPFFVAHPLRPPSPPPSPPSSNPLALLRPSSLLFDVPPAYAVTLQQQQQGLPVLPLHNQSVLQPGSGPGFGFGGLVKPVHPTVIVPPGYEFDGFDGRRRSSSAAIWKAVLQRVPGLMLLCSLPFGILLLQLMPTMYAVLLVALNTLFLYANVRNAKGITFAYLKAKEAAEINFHQRYQSEVSCLPEGTQYLPWEEVIHVIILPNYHEDIDILQETLEVLASHVSASDSYVIVLACEEREMGAPEKARKLIELFRHRFHDILYTLHPSNIPGEAAGKSSNVAYASSFIAGRYRGPKVIVTVQDADTCFREDYFNQVTYKFCTATPEERAVMMFAPLIVFDRNAREVPMPVRFSDMWWSINIAANLSEESRIKIPASAYSLSMDLAESVGFWDVGPESIAEDTHMYLKCFFHTAGKVVVNTIYSPASSCNITGPTFFKGMLARYQQARRHLQGAIDFSYYLENVLNVGNKRHTTLPPLHLLFILFLRLFESHMMGFQLLLIPLAPRIVPFTDPAVLISFDLCFYMGAIGVVAQIITALSYAMYHTWATNSYVGRRRSNLVSPYRIWHLFDWCMLPIAGVMYGAIPSAQAQLAQLLTNRLNYVVAAKPTLPGRRADVDSVAADMLPPYAAAMWNAKRDPNWIMTAPPANVATSDRDRRIIEA